MTPAQFRIEIIDPALNAIGLYSVAASELLLGTAIQESGLRNIDQLGGGPAKGYFQEEEATFEDTYDSYLSFRPELRRKVNQLCIHDLPSFPMLEKYPLYACAMARIKYLRVPEPLPAAGDLRAMGEYWKHFYNSAAGSGTADEFVRNWQSMHQIDAL